MEAETFSLATARMVGAHSICATWGGGSPTPARTQLCIPPRVRTSRGTSHGAASRMLHPPSVLERQASPPLSIVLAGRPHLSSALPPHRCLLAARSEGGWGRRYCGPRTCWREESSAAAGRPPARAAEGARGTCSAGPERQAKKEAAGTSIESGGGGGEGERVGDVIAWAGDVVQKVSGAEREGAREARAAHETGVHSLCRAPLHKSKLLGAGVPT